MHNRTFFFIDSQLHSQVIDSPVPSLNLQLTCLSPSPSSPPPPSSSSSPKDQSIQIVLPCPTYRFGTHKRTRWIHNRGDSPAAPAVRGTAVPTAGIVRLLYLGQHNLLIMSICISILIYIQYYIILFYILYYVILYNILLYYRILYYIILFYVLLYFIILFFILYHIIYIELTYYIIFLLS